MRESIGRYVNKRIPDHHSIFEAATGEEAIQLYEKVHPDWVLMDIAMEPVDGLEASRTILANHPDAKIIILTNYDDPGYRTAAQEAGTRGFVLKEHLSEIGSLLSP